MVNADGTPMEPNVKKPSAFSKFVRKHPLLTTVLCGLLVVFVVYFWKEVEGNFQRKAVVKAANVQLLETDQRMLKLFSKPLVWSIRAEMLRGNPGQVDLLITNLVKEGKFQYIQLVRPDGFVELSTNKQSEGRMVEDKEILKALDADTTVLLNGKDSLITVIAPVMGYDKRLSTLIFSYRPDIFDPLNDKK